MTTGYGIMFNTSRKHVRFLSSRRLTHLQTCFASKQYIVHVRWPKMCARIFFRDYHLRACNIDCVLVYIVLLAG